MSRRYPLGQSVTISTTITDRNGNPADASPIVLTVHLPDGTVKTYSSPAHDGTGLYHQDLPLADTTQLGDYQYTWTATVAGLGGVSYGELEVFDPFELTLITLDDARTQLQIDPADHSDDDWIREQVAGITRVVEQYKHEVIVARAVTQDLDLCGEAEFWLGSVPVISLTSLVSFDAATTYDVTTLDERPSGQVLVLPGAMRPTGHVTAVYQAGYTIIPENYQQGALVTLQHLWESRRGPGAIPGGVTGQEDFYNRTAPFDFPHKAKEWLGPPRPVVG
jgi:hypothetical protein